MASLDGCDPTPGVGSTALLLLLRTNKSVLIRGFASGLINSSGTEIESDSEPTRFIFTSDGSKAAVLFANSIVLLMGQRFESTIASIPLKTPINGVFSPNGELFLVGTRKIGPAPNVIAFCTKTGTCIASFHHKSIDTDVWPPIRWNSNCAFAIRVTAGDGVQILQGSLIGEPLACIEVAGVQKAWLAPAATPRFLTFCPATKSKPGSALVWAFPRTEAPLSSKSMQADGCRVECADDGSAFLVEMNTSASATSYYGDSRLFLMSADGKVSSAVCGLKDGPVHDFSWLPKGDSFIVIAGKSPPAGTLHDRRGAVVYSFGTGAMNTISMSPHGRFVCLGGFGNMAGNVWLWDVIKKKELCPMFNVSCVVSVSWSPDSRYVLFSTTRPRLNVENGVRIYSHRGELVARSDMDALYQAEFRPAPAGAFLDRPASPVPTDSTGFGSSAPKKAASAPYRPPRSTGAVADAMRAERQGTAPGPVHKTGGAASSSGPVGSAPLPELSVSQKKRAKEKAKKEAECAEAELAAELEKILLTASPAVVTESTTTAPDPEKYLKKLTKKLREIEDLERLAASGTALNTAQQDKVAAGAEVRDAIAAIPK